VLEQVRGQSSNVLAMTGLPPIDLIYGYSGVLTSLLAVGGPHMRTAVAELVPRLVDGLRDAEPLTQSGFAHGVAGIMHALARALPHVPEDGRAMVTDTLTFLVKHLAEFFDEREQSWFTNVATPTSFATGWCHGAAGIALGLAACAVALPTATDVHVARDAAVSATRRNGFGRNLTWCHGDLGNHDVLQHIARTAPPPVRHDIEQDVSLIECSWLDPGGLASKLADPHSRYSHTSSLMVGTSGVLLHLAHRLDGGFRVSPVTLDVELS
jgi:lantibiotic modifying enzyme